MSFGGFDTASVGDAAAKSRQCRRCWPAADLQPIWPMPLAHGGSRYCDAAMCNNRPPYQYRRTLCHLWSCHNDRPRHHCRSRRGWTGSSLPAYASPAILVSDCVNSLKYFAHLFQPGFALALDNLTKLPSRSALRQAEKSGQNTLTNLRNQTLVLCKVSFYN